MVKLDIIFQHRYNGWYVLSDDITENQCDKISDLLSNMSYEYCDEDGWSDPETVECIDIDSPIVEVLGEGVEFEYTLGVGNDS